MNTDEKKQNKKTDNLLNNEKMAIVLKNMGKMGRRVEQIENTRPTRFERPNLETRKKSESRTDIPAGIEQNGGPSSQFWSNFIKARANFAAVDFIWLFFSFFWNQISDGEIYTFFSELGRQLF